MKTHASVLGKIVLSFVMVMVAMTIVSFIFAVVGVASGKNLDELGTSIGESLLVHYLQMILFIASSFAMYAFFERRKGWSFGLKQPHGAAFALHGAVGGIILISLSAVFIWACGGIAWQTAAWDQDMLVPMLKGAVLFVGVAISEEIYSRGYIQGLLRYHYGKTPAIVVSSILFALLHSMNPGVFSTPLPIANLFMAGVIMAVAREVTGGLWWPIGLHLTWNYFQGYIYGFNVSGTVSEYSLLSATDQGPAWISGGIFGIEGSVISVVVLILGTMAVNMLYRNRRKQLDETAVPSLRK
ncbi:CPBP family intramembrane glutamic endopeptidase [Paenibacillus lentus]|uniref:CPBP family intramembrane metalloprotease n=1 Tax=Paenibacillus lentus TaxID=1338368 RepID=A0A3S8RQR5_9BACL|nr:CPBP family intramembrane glutamic endopeptidase [Paenibacillus lentus]AZK45286.1 CPBP family intramembrane metalloprotease [Paenibacillus lentus]